MQQYGDNPVMSHWPAGAVAAGAQYQFPRSTPTWVSEARQHNFADEANAALIAVDAKDVPMPPSRKLADPVEEGNDPALHTRQQTREANLTLQGKIMGMMHEARKACKGDEGNDEDEDEGDKKGDGYGGAAMVDGEGLSADALESLMHAL